MTEWAASGRLVAQGLGLEYACWGPPPGAAPSLVLLHEGLGAVALWREFPEALAQATGFGVFAYSRAGYGQSDPAPLPRPLDYMTREALDVLPEVLAAMGITAPVLLGHSDGATIAAIYAGQAIAPICGVVLIAPHFFPELPGLAEIARARAAFEAGDLAARMARFHADPAHTFYGWNDAWLNPDFAGWSITEELARISAPVLGIQGRDDPYGTLAQIEALETHAPGPVDTLIPEGCGHAPHLEVRDMVLEAVAQFCAGLDPLGVAPFPGHAYIPGQTARHPEGAFDAVRDTAQAGLSASKLARTPAFQTGLIYLRAGYHWEAHELLEPVWMALPDASAERDLVQCLIQIANGFLKLKMDRPSAALRLAGMARELMPAGALVMGIARSWVETLLERLETEAKSA